MKTIMSALDNQGGLLFLIFCSMLVFAGITFFVVVKIPNNDKPFVLFSNLTSGFAASLTTAAQVRRSKDDKTEEDPKV